MMDDSGRLRLKKKREITPTSRPVKLVLGLDLHSSALRMSANSLRPVASVDPGPARPGVDHGSRRAVTSAAMEIRKRQPPPFSAKTP